MTGSLALLWRDKPAQVLIAAVYLLCLGALVSFAAIGLATLPQVAASLLTPALALWLFFVWQALCVSYTPELTKNAWLRGAMRLSGTMFLASLPVLLALGASWYWLAAQVSPNSVTWLLARVISWLVLPLAAMQAWVMAARAGVVKTWRDLPQILVKTFKPQSLITYTIGFIVFAGLPYGILQASLPTGWRRGQVAWLVARLIVAVVLAGLGWTLTVMTLARQRN